MLLKNVIESRPSPAALRAAWVKWSTFLGMYLVNIWAVTSMIWGNMSVYTSSYFYSRVKDPGDVQTPWPVSFFFIFWALGMLISKSMYDRFGRRVSCLVGILLVDGGFLLSYLTVQHSVIALAMTLGVAVGLGCGINSSITLVCAVEWTDKYVGIATGSLAASVSIGSVVSNQMITLFVNPDNLRPDCYNGNVRYFSQPEILDRVPPLFLLLGAISSALNIIGLIFLRTKQTDFATESTTLLDEEQEASMILVNVHDGTKEDALKKTSVDAEFTSSVEKLKNKCSQREKDPKLFTDKQGNCRGRFSSRDYTPVDILRTVTFYALSLSIMFSDLTFLTITTYYKTFGLIFITDDHFLTNIGTFLVGSIAIFSCLSGLITDNIRLKTTLVASTSVLALISVFYYFMPILNKWLFGIITVIYAGIMYFNYSLFMVGTLKLFGQTYYSTNYGLATVGGVMMNFVAPPLIHYIVTTFGWFYLFFSIGVANCISLVMVIIAFPLL